MKYLLTLVSGIAFAVVGAVALAKPLKMQAVHLPAAQLFMQLAKQAEVDVVIAGEVDITTHVQWQHVSPRQALLQLCYLPEIACQWLRETSLLVFPREAVQQHVMELFVESLVYASALDVATKLQVEESMLAGGRVVADEEGGQLLMWLPEGQIDQLRPLIRALDKPLPQVQIEARIIIASRDAGASLRRGLQVSMSDAGSSGSNQLAVNGQLSEQAAGLSLGLVAPHILLNLELAAMEATGQVLTLAQPQVVVQHLAEGRIETGQEVPYVITNESGDSRQWKQAVLGLKVTPRVLAQEQVELDLSVVQDSVGELLANGELALNTHRLHTQVRMAFDQTLVLGGALYEQQLQSLMENPAWMALPFMQRWWHSQQQRWQSFELLVFVTPRLITRI
jgi:type II secretory pathway component HofQ